MTSNQTTPCPCCCKTQVGEYDICDVCGWENDPVQSYNLSMRGANDMTLPEARRAYANGEPVE